VASPDTSQTLGEDEHVAYREQDDGLIEDLEEVLDAAFERPCLKKVTEHHDRLD
jgi:hypothetical protein